MVDSWVSTYTKQCGSIGKSGRTERSHRRVRPLWDSVWDLCVYRNNKILLRRESKIDRGGKVKPRRSKTLPYSTVWYCFSRATSFIPSRRVLFPRESVSRQDSSVAALCKQNPVLQYCLKLSTSGDTTVVPQDNQDKSRQCTKLPFVQCSKPPFEQY